MSSDSTPNDDGTVGFEDHSATTLNKDALVGLAEDEKEQSWRYKTTLAPDTFQRHDDCGEIDDEYYTKTLEVRDWPAIPSHGFFDRVTSFSMPNVDVTLSTHITGEDERDADRNLSEAADSLKGKIKNLAKNKWIPDYFVEQAVKEYASVKRTQNTVSSSEYGIYTSHTYIEVRAPDRERLDKAVARIRSRMQDVSADAKPLKYRHRLGYQTAAPACKNYLGGKTKMTGDGLSRLIPWTARNLIEPGGIELGINEDTGDPIVLDLQNRDTGFNVGIWGTIGSGKTTLLTRLLTRTKMQSPEMPVVIIDPKEEFAGFTWLFGGERVVIGSDTGINPLQIEETPAAKLEEIGEKAPYRNAVRRAMDFVRSFYAYMSISFEDKQGTWRTAIQEGYRRRGITDNPKTHHNDSPTFADDIFPIFEEMVHTPENFLRDALTEVDISKEEMRKTANSILQNDIGALEEDGEFEHLSQATGIDIENIDVLYLDLQNFDSETTAGLMMGPLLTAVLEQAKEIDKPMALAMDEFHYMLHNSSSLETLKQAYRHSRHSDLSMITATQSVEEFFTENDDDDGKQLTKSASQLTKLMSVKIWHYLEEMNDEWASEFDMSDAEQQYIEDASTGDPTAQALLQTQKNGSYRLDVNFSDQLNPREFAMNQYEPTDHGTDPLAYLDSYVDRDGRDVTQWTWAVPSDDHLEDEHAESGTELVDGTTVTTDVSDVDTVPVEEESAETTDDAAEHEEDVADGDSSGESASVSESAVENQPDGIASRLKKSVSSRVGRQDSDERNESTANKESEDKSTEDNAEKPSLTDVGTVTARTAGNLRAAGFETVEDVYEAENSALAETEGFDETKAAFIRKQAARTLGRSEENIKSPSDEDDSAVNDGADTANAESPEAAESADQSDEGSYYPESTANAESSSDAEQTDESSDNDEPVLVDVKEVGQDRAGELRKEGYQSVEGLAAAEQNALASVKGIGLARAETIIESASALLDEQADSDGGNRDK